MGIVVEASCGGSVSESVAESHPQAHERPTTTPPHRHRFSGVVGPTGSRSLDGEPNPLTVPAARAN